MTDKPCMLEVCCSSVADADAAALGGAHRLELCAALESGGVTPSVAFAEQASQWARAINPGIKVHALIRYRDGDFLRSPAEANIEATDIEALSEAVDGVVVGALDASGNLDPEAMRLYAETAKRHGLALTCSRAFDLCRDKAEALEQLISWSYDYVLTSGGEPTASAGIATLKALSEQAAGRITLITASGVNEKNCAEIISTSGVRQIHGSLRQPIAAAGPSLPGLEPSAKATSVGLVTQVVEIIKSL